MSRKPTNLKKIRLELARCPEFPEGSPDYGYEIMAPLTDDGHLDVDAWRKVRDSCTVRRFWKGEDDEHGHIVHTRAGWSFSYDPTTEEDDEPIFRLGAHRFVEGEYLSVTEHDGEQRTFEVVSVR